MRRRFLNNINKSISGDNHSEYFTIEALEDGLTAKLSLNACEYRIDDSSWYTLSADTNTPSINKGQTLSFKGHLIPNSGNSSRAIDPGLNFGIGTFTISKKCNLKGNIMSLLYEDDFVGQNDLTGKDHAFYKLFMSCATIVDASELVLPAIILAESCYSSMFWGCNSLTISPELPATTLAYSCYENMFRSCNSLTISPELPATTLAYGCYKNMFEYCSSLVAAPVLPATTLAKSCYRIMFSGCSSLNYIKMLATDISALYCLLGWVTNVATNGTFVKHPDMTSLPTGKDGIPEGWTVINDGEENKPNLITFTISDHEFQAEEGMTWADWYVSNYNSGIISESTNPSKDSIYENLDTLVTGNAGMLYDEYGNLVYFGDDIIKNHTYTPSYDDY